MPGFTLEFREAEVGDFALHSSHILTRAQQQNVLTLYVAMCDLQQNEIESNTQHNNAFLQLPRSGARNSNHRQSMRSQMLNRK